MSRRTVAAVITAVALLVPSAAALAQASEWSGSANAYDVTGFNSYYWLALLMELADEPSPPASQSRAATSDDSPSALTASFIRTAAGSSESFDAKPALIAACNPFGCDPSATPMHLELTQPPADDGVTAPPAPVHLTFANQPSTFFAAAVGSSDPASTAQTPSTPQTPAATPGSPDQNAMTGSPPTVDSSNEQSVAEPSGDLFLPSAASPGTSDDVLEPSVRLFAPVAGPSVDTTPEPSTVLLVGSGLIAVVGISRRRGPAAQRKRG
ncbi:MAG TPA: PEP-CTERM sorting domain-containing protein [Gemmatimonadaceae bacterium]|jgi:hypothetical protein|nr:PEP-CTERM sorting domain-containing protein [Gemmatimonadaceae bacterium]